MIRLEYLEDTYLKENSKEYNFKLKTKLCLCSYCGFHSRCNTRKSDWDKRSWKHYRNTQYRPKEVKL